MKKCKFFMSLLKERDWLEEMAREGWKLTDMTLGIIYHFEKAEPTNKVFEIERFGASSSLRVQDITARRMALDIAEQYGWEVVTHDEEMNYYFMKDREDDETDEFYDEPDLRRERAERYRQRYGKEIPIMFSVGMFFISIIYMFLFGIIDNDMVESFCLWFYLIMATIEIGIIVIYLWWGNKIYDELNLSREEWEHRKAFGVKKSFSRVQQLRGFLQEKSIEGLMLSAFENGQYIFEKSPQRYDYFIDTKRSLTKRLKKQGITYKKEKKDRSSLSLKWYEMSVAEAEKKGLTLVCVVKRDTLIYKRLHSDDKLPWENGNEKIGMSSIMVKSAGLFILGYIAGYIVGFTIKMIENFF